jgi:hypothetical protein
METVTLIVQAILALYAMRNETRVRVSLGTLQVELN